MEPGCLAQSLPSDPRYKGLATRRVLWACLPHLSLEPYVGRRAADSTGGQSSSTALSPRGGLDVPVQTLLQSQHVHVSKRRDLQQVICRGVKAYGGGGRCLHGVGYHPRQL